MARVVTGLRIRPAEPEDVPTVLRFIEDLATYERLREHVVATEADLHRALFGPEAVAEAVLAEREGVPVGFALFFPTFSTFAGRPGLYLEDLFVDPAHRGVGIGRALLAHLAALAGARGWDRMAWSVLDWNEPALRFYEGLGARPVSAWVGYRLTGEALAALAREA